MKMNSMGAQAVLAAFLLLIGTVKSDKASVTFWRDSFTMTCPEDGEWFMGEQKVKNLSKTLRYEHNYDRTNEGEYYCQYDFDGKQQKYQFYVKGKSCLNCYELEAVFMIIAIIVDMIGTVFMMMMIYRCTEKKSSPAPQSSKAPARSGGRAPPVPSPDYELLSPQTRAQDTYSFLNRTG